MPAIYPARYSDRFGEERTTIENDGVTLTMVVRGVQFQGEDFDGFEPQQVSDPAELSTFTLYHRSLCSCRIEADMPIPVVTNHGEVEGLLSFDLELGDPSPPRGIDKEQLSLRLTVDGETYHSESQLGWFEDDMLDLQSRMPCEMFMKVCINCAFSDYSPYGQGLFGGLACFRDNKAGYRTMKGKDGLFAVWDTMSEFVQETHHCPDFERRQPNTGYRG